MRIHFGTHLTLGRLQLVYDWDQWQFGWLPHAELRTVTNHHIAQATWLGASARIQWERA